MPPSSNFWNRWGEFVHDYRWVVIVGWVGFAILLRLSSPDWASVARDGDLEQLPATTSLARGERLATAAFPGDESKSQIVLVFVRESGLTIADREFAIHLGNALADDEGIDAVDVWNEKTPVIGESLRNRAATAQRVVIRLGHEFMATENIRLLARVNEIVAAESAPEGLQIGISGSAAIGGDMLSAAAESVASTHATTIGLVALALVLIYRSPWLVIIPLATIVLAASVSLDVLAIFALWSERFPEGTPSIRVFTTTKIFVIVLLFGAGTDFCLFLTARFREYRKQGETLRDSLAKALAGVGSALMASAFTTIVGLGMMAFADFGKFAYSGPTIAISLAITLVVCLSLVPALLATRLGMLIRSDVPISGLWRRFWEGLAVGIERRPVEILVVSLLLALPLAWWGLRVPVTYDLLSELSPRRVSRQGTELLKRYFPPGEIGPLVVLAKNDAGNLDSVDGQIKIAELGKPLADLPGVSEVRSLYQPLGDPAGSMNLFSGSGIMALAARESPITKAVFVSEAGELAGHVTRLFLILKNQPFSRVAIATLDEVEHALKQMRLDPQSPWYESNFALAGPTVGIRDLEKVTLADRARIQLLVLLAVFIVILVLLRSVGISIYLMASVVLSYLVTIAITAIVFQSLQGSEFVGLDWKVPLFLFVLLVAVGQDYNIYLVTRVFEEQKIHGTREGLRRAIVETGGIITSCGVIMAGTFVSMMVSELSGIVELGFALTLGILLDTFVVRPILVPVFLAILAKRETN